VSSPVSCLGRGRPDGDHSPDTNETARHAGRVEPFPQASAATQPTA
jgi:hypothetical protein